MSEPSKFAIECAATLLSPYSSPVRGQAAAVIQASIDSALAPVMKENISLRLAMDDGMIALHDKLEAERQKSADLSDALAFYADTHNYHDAQWSSGETSIQQDNGRCARDALGRKY